METKLSALVIARNEAAVIERCLTSLAFCDEIVLVDSGSTDGTQDRARALGAQVVEHPFESYSAQKDFGRSIARHPWLLVIDADEVVSTELMEEIRGHALEAPDSVVAFDIPFRNYFRGVWMRHGGYYPDRHIRLFRRERAHFDTSRPIHEQLVFQGDVAHLRGHIDHYTFGSVSAFVAKSARYSETWARWSYASGRRAGALTIAIHTFGRFLRSYVLQRGFVDGAFGLVMSGLQAAEVFQKYARLWELSRFGENGR